MLDGHREKTNVAISCSELTVKHGKKTILHGIDLSLPRGAMTVILGPNGCGKSTLLRSLARVIEPRSGRVTLDGLCVRQLSTKKFARRLSLLPQSSSAPEGLTLCELVALGRHPHKRPFGRSSSTDRAAVAGAIERMGLADLVDRTLDSLSGGQRQRGWIAMTLAQETDLILMDEPTTYLDLKVQVELMDQLCAIRDSGKTLVLVLHDLTLAAAYADHIVLMRDGRIVAEGPPLRLMTPDILRKVFGLEARVITDPETGRPVIIPRIAV